MILLSSLRPSTGLAWPGVWASSRQRTCLRACGPGEPHTWWFSLLPIYSVFSTVSAFEYIDLFPDVLLFVKEVKVARPPPLPLPLPSAQALLSRPSWLPPSPAQYSSWAYSSCSEWLVSLAPCARNSSELLHGPRASRSGLSWGLWRDLLNTSTWSFPTPPTPLPRCMKRLLKSSLKEH